MQSLPIRAHAHFVRGRNIGIPMSDLQLDRQLRRGDQGRQVKLVQEWLSLHGNHVAIDRDFGSATETAVVAFQRAAALQSTGVVDEATFELLIAPMRAALAPIPASGRSAGELVVAYANQHLDQHPVEIGGQNCGPWVRLYMNGNEGRRWKWCAGFACFVLKQACKSCDAALPIAPSFSCNDLAESARACGRFVHRDDAGPGSLFLHRTTRRDWTHTGLVTHLDAETFATIEGNTSDDGKHEGYEVCGRTRGYVGMDFVRI